MLKFLLKATVLVALVSGAFFGGYVIGVFDQESSVAWREASYTASALREIREKRPERAMLLLETRLDYHLLLHAQFDTSPHRISRRMRPFPEEAMRDGIKTPLSIGLNSHPRRPTNECAHSLRALRNGIGDERVLKSLLLCR